MESSPITSWQIDGETMAAVTDLIFLGSKITADGDCSHEVKRCLLLGRKAMTNLKVKVKVTLTVRTNKGRLASRLTFSSNRTVLPSRV